MCEGEVQGEGAWVRERSRGRRVVSGGRAGGGGEGEAEDGGEAV